MAEVQILGLTVCDSCRAARKALEAAGHAVAFRDLRKEPIGKDEILKLWQELGPSLLNKSSTTWRGLSEDEKARDPVELLAEHPTLIKRPIVSDGAKRSLGWNAAVQKNWLG